MSCLSQGTESFLQASYSGLVCQSTSSSILILSKNNFNGFVNSPRFKTFEFNGDILMRFISPFFSAPDAAQIKKNLHSAIKVGKYEQKIFKSVKAAVCSKGALLFPEIFG